MTTATTITTAATITPLAFVRGRTGNEAEGWSRIQYEVRTPEGRLVATIDKARNGFRLERYEVSDGKTLHTSHHRTLAKAKAAAEACPVIAERAAADLRCESYREAGHRKGPGRCNIEGAIVQGAVVMCIGHRVDEIAKPLARIQGKWWA